MAEPAEMPLVFLVCTGAVALQGGKQGLGFMTLTPSGDLGEAIYFARKGLRFDVGAVYEMPGNHETGRYSTAKATWKRLWPDREQALEWRVMHDAKLLQEEKAKGLSAAKAEARKEMWAGLDPIREAYAKAGWSERANILAVAAQYIQGRV